MGDGETTTDSGPVPADKAARLPCNSWKPITLLDALEFTCVTEETIVLSR